MPLLRPAPSGASLADLGDRLAFGALVAFAIFAYTSIAWWIPATAPLRPALTVSGVAAGGALLGLWAGGRSLWLDGWRGAAVFAICLLSEASVAWSFAPRLSADTALEVIKEGLVYLVILQTIRGPARLRAMAAAVALAAVVPAAGALANYVQGTDLVDGGRARWLGVFADPNHLAMALSSAVPLALLFAARGRGLVRRLVFAGAAAMEAAGVVVTQSRGGAVGLAAGVAAFVLAGRAGGKRRGFLVAAALVAGIAVFAPAAFWTRAQTLAAYQTDASALGRVHAWEVLYRLVMDRPFTGTGAGAFLAAWPRYAPLSAGRHAYVTHNVFFQPLAELGLGGFLAFLLLVSSCLAASLCGRRAPATGPVAGALFSALAGNLVCQLSSGYSPNAFLFLLLGLAAAADRSARDEIAAPSPRCPTPLFA